MKSMIFHYCRILSAVVLLRLVYFYCDSIFLKYLFFTLILLFMTPSLKEEIKKPLDLKKTLLFTVVFLALSMLVSSAFKSDAVEIKGFWSILSVTLLAPVYEEIFFRKCLMEKMPPFTGVAFSSLVFALFHSPSVLISAFFAGVALSIIYKLSGDIKIPIIAHMANNVLALIILS